MDKDMTVAMGHPYLYRVYDTKGVLIYIGSTWQLRTRLSVHRGQSWWAWTVGRVECRLCPSVEAARTAERQAILTEKPRWNRVEHQGRVLYLPQCQFYDFVYGWVATLVADNTRPRPVCPIRDIHHRRLAKYKRVYERRFGVPLDVDFNSIDLYRVPDPLAA